MQLGGFKVGLSTKEPFLFGGSGLRTLVSASVALVFVTTLAGQVLLAQDRNQTSEDERYRTDRQETQSPDQGQMESRREPVERSSDWGTDNLDRVAASAQQIREVLRKDAGLMVELKRLMAKQSTDRGQIVSERDLDDDVVMGRLDTDPRFRALATRLLQRYGYLTPQLNPDSAAGQEQALEMKARAERLATLQTYPPYYGGQYERLAMACGPGTQNPNCVSESGGPMRNSSSGVGSYGPPCDPNTSNVPCPAPTDRNLSPSNSEPRRMEQQPSQPEQIPQPDMLNTNLLTASSAATSRTGRNDNSEGGAQPSESRTEISEGIIPVLPESASRESESRTLTTNRPKFTPLPEPVEMVHAASPYAYLPSLYDLYIQAAPRTSRLERFGLAVFRHEPGSEEMPMDLPAGPDYVLGPGDAVTIDLWGGISGRMFRTVDREGRLSLPEVGPIQVNGKTLGEVQESIQKILRTQYRDVSADISIARVHTVRVYVVGEVNSPGAYDISSLSTPLNALMAAGGITARGSLRHMRHFRGNEMVEEVDAYNLLLNGVHGDLKNLANGDTLLVPPVGPQVTIDGMVRRPAVYELAGETNLSQALELAGGVLPAAALKHIEVQRLDAHEKRTMVAIDLDERSDPDAVRKQLEAFKVRDGDEIHIFPIAAYNTAAVYLQGHVQRPGRYAFTPGMRLTDLVGSYRDLLPEPAQHYAEIISLREPDWRPVVESVDLAAAFEHPEDSPKLSPLDTVRIYGRYDLESAPSFTLAGEIRSPGEYRTSGQMHLRDAIYQAGGILPDAALDSAQLFRTQSDGSLKILNVNLAAALDADPLENVLVEPRDRIIVHRSEYREDPPSVYVRGEVVNPGRYPLGQGMRVADLLAAAGGPKRSADLTNGDLTRYFPIEGGKQKGERHSVLLADLPHNEAANVPLKDGDVLSVPELPGWKDLGSSITIQGEVRNPGVYGIRPGERLSSVIKRAGGLLPTAYPQGAIFIRPSVRDLQEKSRDELIQRVEQEGAAVKSSVTASGGEQAELAAAAAAQQQRVLESLRNAPISGRMVIRMRAGLKNFDNSSQDIEVRDGDSLNIPKQPGIVLIVGQVYNSNAITYVAGRSAGWYLSQSGGATQLADRHAVFIVRADGEITSRHQGGWWSENVLSSMIRPGDTIVVPERAFVGDTKWKDIIAIAQIAEAGAITAAVVF